ncbi:hypothetical protein FJY69_00775 [candidate division WOR-3 bacterium]|nr:hypothetical protein [candidate division WOR-3 bacterium]
MMRLTGRKNCPAALLALGLVLAAGCEVDKYSTLVVTGQVAKTLSPESNTASILLGEATVQNIQQGDWLNTPDPTDTSFGTNIFPATITPVGNATAKLNSTNVAKRLPGIYFEPALSLEYKARYELEMKLDDGRRVTAYAFLPDSFSVVAPRPGDSLDIESETLRVVWTKSDSARRYVVGITPADSGSTALGWSGSRTDTFCIVPAAAFKDTNGVAVPGNYIVNVTALNGGWKKGGLDLLFAGGNVSGAVGLFGCAVYARPVAFIAR